MKTKNNEQVLRLDVKPLAKRPSRKKRPAKVDYFNGTGRRKSAVARVRLTPSATPGWLLNKKPLTEFKQYIAPLESVGKSDAYQVSILVSGGGSASQVDAIRMGIARALLEASPDFKPTLKRLGFLTRDPREKERKKYGLKSARRGPQFAKR